MAKLTYTQLTAMASSLIEKGLLSNASFNITRNNVVGLLDKIGKVIMVDTDFEDRLAELGGDDMQMGGRTIEEWQEDLILPQDYDSSGSGAMSRHDSTYRPVFYSYTIGRKKIPTTIPNNDVERAVHNAEQFASIIAMKSKRLYDSELAYRYHVKMEILGKLISLCEEEMSADSATEFVANTNYKVTKTTDNYTTVNVLKSTAVGGAVTFGVVVKEIPANTITSWADAVSGGYVIVLDLITTIAKPVDTETGEAFIKQLKKDVEISQDMSEGHSLNGNTLGTTKYMKLFVRQNVIPSLEVDTQAGAFQLDKISVPVPVKVIKGFGSANSKYYGLLIDVRGVKLHNTYRAVRENFNGDGDFLNLFLHMEHTAWISRNVFVKVYKDVD